MDSKADKSDPSPPSHGPYLRTVRGTGGRAPCAPPSSKSQNFHARARRTGGHGHGTTFSKLDGSTIHTVSRRQQSVQLLTFQAELSAISVALTELEWYSSIISTLPIGNSAPLRILNDNKAGVDALHSPTYMEEKKQHDVKLKFVREQIEREFVELKWIPGTENIADLLTKALPARRVLELGKRYGLIGWPTDGTWGAC